MTVARPQNSSPAVFDRVGAIRVTAPRGAADLLAEEAAALGAAGAQAVGNGVELTGTLADCMRLNLHLRTANRVLFRIDSFAADGPEALYRAVRTIPWEDYLPVATPFSVHGFIRHPTIRDTRFAGLRVKDAVADRFTERFGRRPDSGPGLDRFVIFLHWAGDRATVYLDTSGETLSRRGYRKIPLDAPLGEALAAALIRATWWDVDSAWVNPMCGSGTLAIEAALQAAGAAPGLGRSNFGFLHIRGFDRRRWEAMKNRARRKRQQTPSCRIIATDVRPEAIAAARQNARKAGVEKWIEFAACDFRSTTVPDPPGVVMINPAYGRRLGDEKALAELYPAIGDFFKQRCPGYAGFVFTGNPSLAKRIGLRPTRRRVFFNGPIECRLLSFELYAGSRAPGR